MNRLQNWKMQTKGEVVELYDLGKDIQETTNVADQYPDRAKQMKEAIEKWKLDVAPESTRASGTRNTTRDDVRS